MDGKSLGTPLFLEGSKATFKNAQNQIRIDDLRRKGPFQRPHLHRTLIIIKNWARNTKYPLAYCVVKAVRCCIITLGAH